MSAPFGSLGANPHGVISAKRVVSAAPTWLPSSCPTWRGKAARTYLDHLRSTATGLIGLDLIGPGPVSISAGTYATGAAPLAHAAARDSERHSTVWVMSPGADGWLKVRVAPSSMILLNLLIRRQPDALTTAARQASAQAARIFSFSRRISDLRALGFALSVERRRNHEGVASIIRLHSIVRFDPPNDDLPITTIEEVIRRRLVVAVAEQAMAAKARLDRRLIQLLDTARRWGCEAEARAALAAAEGQG